MVLGIWFWAYGFAGACKLFGVRSAKEGRVKHESIPPYEIKNSIIEGIYTFLGLCDFCHYLGFIVNFHKGFSVLSTYAWWAG